MIKLNKYAKLLLKEQAVDKSQYENIITNAIVSIFDIDHSNVNTEVLNFAKRANYYHNLIFCSSIFDYKNKTFQIKIVLYHIKVPWDEAIDKKNAARAINQLNSMPHIELTKQLLQKTTHLLSFETSCNVLKPKYFEITQRGDNIKTNRISDGIVMCKKLIDDYIDGDDGDNGDDEPVTPIEPSGKLVTV